MGWEPQRIEKAIRHMSGRFRFSVSGELRVLVIEALWAYLDHLRRPTSPVYTVDQWMPDGNGIADQIATSQHGGVAAAAYEAAVLARPGQKITLRNGIRVVRSTDGDRRLSPDGLIPPPNDERPEVVPSDD